MADLNHFAHPFSADDQIQHPAALSWDRIGGVVLFALSMLIIVPACFYLYWASRKIDHVDQLKPGSVDDRISQEAAAKSIFKSRSKDTLGSVAGTVAASAQRLNSIDETMLTKVGNVDDEFKIFLIRSINEAINKGNRSVSKDVKILIYAPLGRMAVRDEGVINTKISQENISHIIFLHKSAYNLMGIHLPSLNDKKIFNIFYEVKLDDKFLKKHNLLDRRDFDKLVQDITK